MLQHKFDLGFFPTPLHPLKRLSGKYPGYHLFIKRDDLTGLAAGGNKTRKLEYLIRKAIDEGCDTVITAGAQQSNHCRQTAAACAVAGLACHLLLGGTEPEAYDGNLLLSHLLGAAIHFTGAHRKGEDIPALKDVLAQGGKKCFIIPYGGSDITGALGFVHAVRELKDQLQEQNLHMDYIFFASSSGGTQAGLTLGMELFKLDTELMPVSIDKATTGIPLEAVVHKIVTDGRQLLHIEKDSRRKDIPLLRGYDAAGYGVITANEISAVRELALYEGILLDPVYTGRAFHGMLDCLKKKKIRPGARVLFWHTGGLPATFHYAEALMH